MATRTLNATKCAVIREATPSTHVTLASTFLLESDYGSALLCEFDLSTIPDGELIQSVKLDVYIASITNGGNGSTSGYVSCHEYGADFNAETITWNTSGFSRYSYPSWQGIPYSGASAYIHGSIDERSTKLRFILWNYTNPSANATPTINTSTSSSNKLTLTVTTSDSVPTAQNLTPNQTFIDGAASQQLSWTYSNEAGGAQKSFQIQKSQDNSTWADVATVTSANTYYDLPADTFSAGHWYWRVKVTSEWDIASEWSASAHIVVQADPAAPYITSGGTGPRPTVVWQAVDQQAYQITAGTYDSGTVFGTVKTHKVPIYLPDGAATVKVRIQNSFGLWSPWSEVGLTVTHSGVATVTLSATQSNSEISLSWTGAHGIYYIYRDDDLIASTTAKSYVDRLTNGAHSYTVRGATDDAYDLSAAVPVTAVCTTAMMADIDNISWVYLRGRRGAKPSVSASISQQIVYQHYSGRALPVADISEHVDEAYTFEYSFLTVAEANAARALLGKVVIFKTPRDCIIGVLESTPYNRDRWSTDFTFTIRAVDYLSGVTYV
jgi:hypothetical protein